MDNQNIQDPREEGTSGLKGLKGVGTPDNTPSRISKFAKNYKQETFQGMQNLNPKLEIGFVGVGDSRYDKNITSSTLLENLNNTRAELQPWYDQIGAGLAKGAVLAGTTFADGVVGTIAGLGNLAKGAIEGDAKLSDFWNNPFSVAAQQVNNWSEQALPNYYTDAERNDPWYQHIFTANFVGDKVLKNLGFAVGAAYTGKLEAGLMSKVMGLNEARLAFKGAVNAAGESLTNPDQILGALKGGDAFIDGALLTSDLVNSAKKLKYADPVLLITGAMTGAMGEARIEAITNTQDWFNLHKQLLDDTKSNLTNKATDALKSIHPDLFNMSIDADGNILETPSPIALSLIDLAIKEKFDYDGGLKKITEDRLKMGNVDFMLNLPLLTISDAWQFGKFYAGGYKTARRASNVIKDVAENGTISYSANKIGKLATAGKILQKGIAEGPYEEMMQQVASQGSGDKYASELNDFYGAKIDPDAELKTISWMKAMGNAMVETYGTAQGWEQGAIGGLTGLIGIPTFRGIKNSETGKFQSPIQMAGGMKEDIKEVHEQNEQSDELVNQLNARVQSPEFLNYYQGAIRHNKFQQDMDNAAETGDNYEFKNAEHSQLISDAILFDRAGRILDLYDHIDAAANVTPELIEKIKQLSVRKDGTSVYDGVKDEDILNKIKNKATETKQSVDNYSKIADDLRVLVGNNFHGDELDELTWMMTKIGDWEGRFKDLHKDLSENLREIASVIQTDPKGEEKANNLRDIAGMNPMQLIRVLGDSKNKDYLNQLNTVKQVLTSSKEANKDDLLSKFQDLIKVAAARNDFIDKYDGYIKNPTSLTEKILNETKETVTKKTAKDNKELKDQLSASTDLSQFREALNKELDPAKRLSVVDELEKEGNPLAKNHKEVSSYKANVIKNIYALNETPEAKTDAVKLFNNNYNNSENLEEAANPNSIHFDDTEVTHDEGLTEDANLIKHQNAQWTLMQAMHKANNDAKFKDRFSGELLELTDKRSEATKSQQTIPVDNAPPIGDISPELLQLDNSILNNSTPSPTNFAGQLDSNGLKQYYHPTIPELHIEASKKGDYRPFPEVVSEREPDKDYSGIYNYLRDNGAFDYINLGKLKVGDDVHFMIDPSFTEFGPDITTIFMIKNLSNGEHLIIGSLNANDNVVSRYEGLKELREKIILEYKDANSKERFIASPVTKVSLIMTGKIAFTNTETSLKDVDGIKDHEGETIFGIIKNGTLSTNDKVNDLDIVKPGNLANKEGRLYLLVKDPSGKYRPIAIRVKHFNKESFPNLSDPELLKSPMFARLLEAFKQYSEVTNEETEKDAFTELKKRLYMGNIHTDFVSSEKGDYIRFTKVFKDENGKEIYDETGETPKRKEVSIAVPLMTRPNVIGEVTGEGLLVSTPISRRDNQSILNDIEKAIYSFDLPFQVNLQQLNTSNNNTFLINSDILSANMDSTKFLGSWFTTQAFDNEGNILDKSIIPNKKITPNQLTPTGGVELVIKGTEVKGNNGVVYNVTPTAILDKNGVKMTLPEDIADHIRTVAWIKDTFGDAMNSSTMINGKILLPDGRGYDRSTKLFLTAELVVTLQLDLKTPNKTPVSISSPTSIPIYNKDLESKNPVNNTSKDYLIENSKIGYVLKDSTLTKTFIAPIGTIEGIDVYMIKTPNFDKEGKVLNSVFHAVFSNGLTVPIVTENQEMGITDNFAGQEIITALSGNIPRLKELSELNTSLTETKEVNNKNSENIDKSLNNSNPADLANKAANQIKPSNTRKKTLREVDDLNRPIWNQQEELGWLQRVLPQLNQNDLVKIQKGLIKVAQNGALAWGSFGDGIMTLSDIAAKGTVYHEAFHVVFQSLLSQEERDALYTEAKILYGNLEAHTLEEKMAEGFREYMMAKETKGLGLKIIGFFKELFTKITHWNTLKPSLTSYYYNINKGNYAYNSFSTLNIFPNSKVQEVVYHHSSIKITLFNQDKVGSTTGAPDTVLGTFFAEDPRDIPEMVKEKNKLLEENGHDLRLNYSVLNNAKINLTNPYVYYGFIEGLPSDLLGLPTDHEPTKEDYLATKVKLEKDGYDGIIYGLTYDPYDGGLVNYGYVVFNTNLIHILVNNDSTLEMKVNSLENTRKEGILLDKSNVLLTFDALSKEDAEYLTKKGWNQQTFDKVSQEEKEHALRCATL